MKSFNEATTQSRTTHVSAVGAPGDAEDVIEGTYQDNGSHHAYRFDGPERRPLRALIQQNPRWVVVTAALLWATLFLPPVRKWFEASMFRHMIFQLPLLASIGWIAARALMLESSPALTGGIARIQLANRWGATGLLLAISTMTIWMLPLTLDNARLDMHWALAKFFSVPLWVGAAVAMSWHRCPSIVRGVIHVEVIATFWRFGWGYLAMDERLCLSYLLGDQQRTGTALCGIGLLWALMAVWKPLFGPQNIRSECRL